MAVEAIAMPIPTIRLRNTSTLPKIVIAVPRVPAPRRRYAGFGVGFHVPGVGFRIQAPGATGGLSARVPPARVDKPPVAPQVLTTSNRSGLPHLGSAPQRLPLPLLQVGFQPVDLVEGDPDLPLDLEEEPLGRLLPGQ